MITKNLLNSNLNRSAKRFFSAMKLQLPKYVKEYFEENYGKDGIAEFPSKEQTEKLSANMMQKFQKNNETKILQGISDFKNRDVTGINSLFLEGIPVIGRSAIYCLDCFHNLLGCQPYLKDDNTRAEHIIDSKTGLPELLPHTDGREYEGFMPPDVVNLFATSGTPRGNLKTGVFDVKHILEKLTDKEKKILSEKIFYENFYQDYKDQYDLSSRILYKNDDNYRVSFVCGVNYDFYYEKVASKYTRDEIIQTLEKINNLALEISKSDKAEKFIIENGKALITDNGKTMHFTSLYGIDDELAIFPRVIQGLDYKTPNSTISKASSLTKESIKTR